MLVLLMEGNTEWALSSSVKFMPSFVKVHVWFAVVGVGVTDSYGYSNMISLYLCSYKVVVCEIDHCHYALSDHQATNCQAVQSMQ